MIRRDSPPLSSPPKSNAFLVLVTALTAVGLIACSANVRANQLTEEAQQLIRLTTVDNILRIDAEQAGFLMDQLPEELPAELQTKPVFRLQDGRWSSPKLIEFVRARLLPIRN